MPQNDPFKKHLRGLDSPGMLHLPIVPQDGVDIPDRPRALYVLTSGILVVRDEAGTTVPYPVFAGQTFGFSAVGIEATGTTATVAGWW